VPSEQAGPITDALAEKLKAIRLGDPREADTRMGPLVTRAQQQAVLDGVGRLAVEASIVCGGEAPRLAGIDAQKSAFVAPTLMRAKGGATSQAVHEVEIFGPAATVVPYRDLEDACALVARGGGSLVASVYGEDKDLLLRMIAELGAGHGRILAVDPAIAAAHTGHGIVMPQCNHGGPGRAGAGEELGGSHGLRFYHQRLALQGSSDLLGSMQAQAASMH
jgi:3,4-dehydroadipyl-CoA semialdehyde dehydrogenase